MLGRWWLQCICTQRLAFVRWAFISLLRCLTNVGLYFQNTILYLYLKGLTCSSTQKYQNIFAFSHQQQYSPTKLGQVSNLGVSPPRQGKITYHPSGALGEWVSFIDHLCFRIMYKTSNCKQVFKHSLPKYPSGALGNWLSLPESRRQVGTFVAEKPRKMRKLSTNHFIEWFLCWRIRPEMKNPRIQSHFYQMQCNARVCIGVHWVR